MARWMDSHHLEGQSLQHRTREKENECFPFFLDTSGAGEIFRPWLQTRSVSLQGSTKHLSLQAPTLRRGDGNHLVTAWYLCSTPKAFLLASLPLSLLWADILQKASESIALSNETLSSTRQPVLIYGNHPSELLFCVFLDRQTVSCMCL